MTTGDGGGASGWRGRIAWSPAVRAALVLAVVLALPFCLLGIFMDDYFQLLLVEGVFDATLPGRRWNLFTFTSGDPTELRWMVENGPFPWWSLPGLKFSFFRPLSSALANLDAVLFGRHFVLHHLHSIAWHLGLVAVASAVYRRALGTTGIAAVALLVFATDDSHGLAAGWLANRNALVATAPALLGLLAHLKWREGGGAGWVPLSMLGMTVGLCGGESALGALAYLAAYELTTGPGRPLQRAAALVPAGVVLAAYVVAYKLTGSGAYGSEIYVDPLRDPAGFLEQAPGKALALFGSQFLGVTADLWLIMTALRPVLMAAGLVAAVLVGALARRVWPSLDAQTQRGVKWLGVGGLLALVPVLATFPLNRLLLMPSLGGAAFVAVVLWHGWRHPDDALLRWGARIFAVTVVALGVLGWGSSWLMLGLGAKAQTDSVLRGSVSDEALGGRVVAFVAPDPAAAIYPPMVRLLHGKPRAASWVTLSFAPYVHRLTRVDDATVDVEVVDGHLGDTVFEQLVRSSKFPVPVGMTVKLNGLSVEVLSLDRGWPNKIRVRFDEGALSTLTLVRYSDEGLQPLVLPAVGQTLDLPRVKTVLSM